MIIAVDGPLASGKGTIARALADHFGGKTEIEGGVLCCVLFKIGVRLLVFVKQNE